MSMSFSRERKILLNKISIIVVLIVIVISISLYLGGVVDDFEKKNTWLKNDISETGRKLEGLNKKTLEFSEGVKVWESLPNSDKELPGLRINDAKDTIDKLQKKYKLSSVKTSFSKPDEIIGDYKTDTVGMVSSLINISFNALSDEYVYEFIADISKNFPGYVQVKALSINKPSIVSKEMLKRISLGEEVAVLSVTMDFYWHDLKYKGPSKNPETPPAGEVAK